MHNADIQAHDIRPWGRLCKKGECTTCYNC